MTGAGKLLKITSLVGLFLGLGTIALGVFYAVANMADIDAWATALEGVLATVYGVRTAILANVPSNTDKIRRKALILAIVALAVVAFFIAGGQDVQLPQLCVAVVVALVALVAFFIAHGIVKEQLRK